MPIQKTKNENFFKTWSSDMAYVLGFFTADGAMYFTRRGTHFIEFQITDGGLLLDIQKALESNHKVTVRRRGPSHHKIIYRLQIGSKEIFTDLAKLGLMQNKSNIVRLPTMPDEYLGDFLRGYFDGDGNIAFGYFKKTGRDYLCRAFSARFTSGSYQLLKEIKDKLEERGLRGSLFFSSGGWRLNYGAHASIKLFMLMYNNGTVADLIYLERKYKIFKDALASQPSLRP
jgi:hypothetical protein